MTSFASPAQGRVILIHLEMGDLFLENIQAALAEHGVKNAVLTSAIGTLRKLCMHIVLDTNDTATNHYICQEKPFEVGAVQGLVLDGVPHFHMVASAPGGEMFVGHVEPGCQVQYLMEISLMELPDVALTRKPNAFGVDAITPIA